MQIDNSKIKKIGIVMSSGIGDVIVGIPTLRSIKKNFSNSKTIVITGNLYGKKILENCPYVDQIISITKKNLFNKIIFLCKCLLLRLDIFLSPGFDSLENGLIGRLSGARKRVCFKSMKNHKKRYNIHVATKFSIKTDTVLWQEQILQSFTNKSLNDSELENFIDYNSHKKNIDQTLNKLGILKKDKILCVHLGGMEKRWMKMGEKGRLWPTEYWKQTLHMLQKIKNLKIIFIGGKDNTETVKKIIKQSKLKDFLFDFTGRSLEETTYLISICKIFLGTDSGPIHIAMSLKKNIIGILWYGNHNTDKYIKFPFRKKYPKDTTPKEVVYAVNYLLSKKS